MVSERLARRHNPWWADRYRIADEPAIRKWESSRLGYDPRLRHAIDLDNETDVVHTLRGPRQVGKTTLIMLHIRDLLCERGVEPWRVLYYPLDLASGPADIVDLIDMYHSRIKRDKAARTYAFLDEASSIRNWPKGIKSLYDRGALENYTVLLTGSQALNIKKESERLPGRRGSTRDPYDHVLLPMRFSEFARVLSADVAEAAEECGLASPEGRAAALEGLRRLEIPDGLDRLHGHIDSLDDLLDEYLLTGGTPRVVDERRRTGAIGDQTYSEYSRGIAGDWEAESKRPEMLGQVMGAIIPSIGSLTSWCKMAGDMDVARPQEARDYVEALKRLFVVDVFHRYNRKKAAPMLRSPKKIHFVDPFYLHVFNPGGDEGPMDAALRHMEDAQNVSRMVEGVVGNHLLRMAFDRSGSKHLFDASRRVFYWRDEKGREVDYVVRAGGDIPVEVKYQDAPRSLGGLYSFMSEAGAGPGLVVSRSWLGATAHYASVPASLFLMLV